MKETCPRCNKKTLRITDTICGRICEKCIREIREDLRFSLATIHCDVKRRKEELK